MGTFKSVPFSFAYTRNSGGILMMQILKRSFILAIILVLTLMTYPVMAGGHGAKGGPPKPVIPGGDTINISGIILDTHKEAIDEAEVLVLVNGKEVDRVVTADNGKYVSRFQMEKDKIQSANIHIEIHKTSFKSQSLEFKGSELAQKHDHFYISEDITMPRVLGPALWISPIVFILAYVLIAFELLHRT